MATATFRFYGELNDFLAYHQRQRDEALDFHVGPTVKDAIEAFGVPHTEVDLLVVNGAPVDFDHRVLPDDRVAVYPTFRSIDLDGLPRLRDSSVYDRFVADGHLATLARYLRLLGFDTILDQGWDDETIASAAVTEGRLLITRDRGLLKRKVVVHGLFVRDDDPDDQLVDVVRRLRLGARIRPFTRCMACNGSIHGVEKTQIEDALEPRTWAVFDEFRQCASCGRVYWKGSHYDRLVDIVDRAARADDDLRP